MYTRALKLSSVCFLLLGAAPVWAVNHDVTVGGASNTFSPSMLSANVGDTVTFTNALGFHNVVSDPGAAQSFRCSTDCTTANPSNAAWSQQITLTTVGTIGYHCEVHGGMTGSITVTTPVSLQSFEVE